MKGLEALTRQMGNFILLGREPCGKYDIIVVGLMGEGRRALVRDENNGIELRSVRDWMPDFTVAARRGRTIVVSSRGDVGEIGDYAERAAAVRFGRAEVALIQSMAYREVLDGSIIAACIAYIGDEASAGISLVTPHARSTFHIPLEPGHGRWLASSGSRLYETPRMVDIGEVRAAQLKEELYNRLAPHDGAKDTRLAIAVGEVSLETLQVSWTIRNRYNQR